MPTYHTPEAASHNDRQEWQPWAGIREMREQNRAGKGEILLLNMPILVFVSQFHIFHRIWDLGSFFRFMKLKQCAHFEWLDEYIERIQLEGASGELDLPLEAEKLDKFGSGTSGSGAPGSSHSIGATVGDAGVTAELRKLNKQMKKLIELQKQGNLMGLMAGLFMFV